MWRGWQIKHPSGAQARACHVQHAYDHAVELPALVHFSESHLVDLKYPVGDRARAVSYDELRVVLGHA